MGKIVIPQVDSSMIYMVVLTIALLLPSIFIPMFLIWSSFQKAA
jgi:hypothetical protein